MTQIDKIKAEIERLKHYGTIPYDRDVFEGVCLIESFINSLPAEQPSEDLEKAANIYANKQGLELKPFASKFFKSGAQWQKEQMMKGFCYETTVYRDEEGDGIDTPIESWLALENNEITNLPNIGLKEGEKVKVIIVKEARNEKIQDNI